MQFVVDRSKSGGRIANGAAAIGQPPRATNELQQFEFHRTVGDRITAIPASSVSVHAGKFGGACEEREGAAMIGLPGSTLLVARRSVLTRLSSGFGALPTVSAGIRAVGKDVKRLTVL